MPTQILLQCAGPLPLLARFTAPVGAPPRLEVLFTVHGSAFSLTDNQVIGLRLTNEFGEQMATATLYANQRMMHLALVPAAFPRIAPPGHECQVHVDVLTDNTTVNADDTFLITASY